MGWGASVIKLQPLLPVMPFLEALGTAVPGSPVKQADVRAKAEEVLSVLAPDLVEKLSVFDTVGIDERFFVRPIAWFLEEHGWAERAALYADEGVKLLESAARQALERAALAPGDVDGVVLVSTTGIATPSLDARLVNRLGLWSDVTRVPVFGLGCAGGVAGVNLAASLAAANPEKRYLLLCLETCSLNFDLQDMSVRAFVATTLFADGCAAAIVSGDRVDGRPLARWRAGASHQWPDSERVMGWDVTDEGLRVVFSRSIPDIVARDFAPVVEAFLKREAASVDRHVYHPGGTKVLEAYERALGLRPAQLDTAREALRAFGNMSSPTVLFALDASLASPLAPGETVLLAALGPGFAAELALLEG